MAFSFSTAGSTPTNPFPSTGILPTFGSTSQDKALASAVPGVIQSSGTTSFGTQIQPSTAVKSYTAADGAKTEYHAPITSGTSPTGHTTALPGQSEGILNQPPATQQYSSTNPPTYPGLVSTVANQGAGPSAIQTQASGEAQNAYGTYQGYIGQLKGLQEQEAEAEKANSLNPVPMGDITGRGQALHDFYATKEAAAASAAQGAAGLFSPALSGAVNAQGQQFGAANNAANLGRPELGAIGTQNYYNPLTGSSSGGGSPFSGGQVQGDVALGQQYAQNVSANNQAKAIKSQIQSTLATNPTLNPSAFPDLNTALQFLNGKVSNPAYQTLSNQLQEYINTLAPILGVGGDTTNLKTQIANGFINAKANGGSISQVLDSIEQLAQAKLVAQQGGSGSTGGATGATSTGGGLYDF